MPICKHFVLTFMRESVSHNRVFVKAIYKPETGQVLLNIALVKQTIGNALFHPNVYTRDGGESTEFSNPIQFSSPGVKERFEDALRLHDVPRAIVILASEAEVNHNAAGTLLRMIDVFNEYLSKRTTPEASIGFTEVPDEEELRDYSVRAKG